jgi:formate dehydrogenase major subunit
VPGLGARFGRGGATTTQQSLADSDCIVIMGSNMAENHPVGFRFVMKAKERGATVIHVDPRFSRTSAMADLHVPLRAGTDVAFLGGLINYAINSDRWDEDSFALDYLKYYTNAPVIISEDFRDTEDLGGIFSGLNDEGDQYDFDSWQYAGETAKPAPEKGEAARQATEARPQQVGKETHLPEKDMTLQHPRCVFQIVKRHFSRYTPEMVERICGVPQDLFLNVADALVRNSKRDRTSVFCYAVAWTQHTIGTQMISCCALLQLLLGNVGRPGGGILALRGHATIQGSTDIPTLFNLLPGYMPMPAAIAGHDSLDTYIGMLTPETGFWHNMPKFIVSLLKAWYGEAATAENGYAFDLVPKLNGDYSFEQMLPMMKDGVIKGLFCMGMNPAVGGQNTRLAREGLANLDWLVIRDPYEIESAAFWYDSPEVRNGDIRPEDIKTEIFFMPPAVTPEKDGSYTNTQRLVQWHDKAVDPPGDCRSEPWFLYHLGLRLKELYKDDDTPKGQQIRALTWDYPTVGPQNDPELERVVAEINGYTVADGKLISGFSDLQDDGSTACGCWIYSGIMPEEGVNMSRNRKGSEGAALGWGFSWPKNIRLLYNRASADLEGKPWSERKKWIWWDEDEGRWTGYDVPDCDETKPPDAPPRDDASGTDAHGGDSPFQLMADGKGWLFSASGLQDGPLPTHYEPWETPIRNLLYPERTHSPVVEDIPRPDNPYHEIGDPRFPYVITTYRLTEHHTAGGMSRWLPWLAELQPEGFVEISPELASEHGVDNGDWVTLTTLRGEVEAKALVTDRMQPLTIDGRTMHQVGMPWHFGWGGIATGDIANDLSALIEDPNSKIHEGKSFTCNLRKGRKHAGEERS